MVEMPEDAESQGRHRRPSHAGARIPPMSAFKADLHRYLQAGRDAVLAKMDGLSDYDTRRPLVPTGTNLLGLVKHLASVELGYFGGVFGRPSSIALPWFEEGAEPNADMWATPDESRAQIVELYHQAWERADATIDALALDATGMVPWWNTDRPVTLHHILIHVTAETHRHAGHADLVRELVDGQAGYDSPGDNLPPWDAAGWAAYRRRLQEAAEMMS